MAPFATDRPLASCVIVVVPDPENLFMPIKIKSPVPNVAAAVPFEISVATRKPLASCAVVKGVVP